MSKEIQQTPISAERIERSIIRKIGRTRYQMIKEYISEGIAVDLLVEEFGLKASEIQFVINQKEEPVVQFRRTQTR